VVINSKYYREQFDDWLAGGKIEYKRRIYYWSARNSNYGWEIEPIKDKDWYNLSDKEFNKIITFIKECIHGQKTDHTR
jgi:hypothetical protein